MSHLRISEPANHGEFRIQFRIAGLYVSDAGGTLSATVGRDMTLTAAQVASGGSVELGAERNLTLDSITTADSLDARWSADNTRQSEVTRAEGTHIQAAGDVRLSAGGDLTARAVDIGRVPIRGVSPQPGRG